MQEVLKIITVFKDYHTNAAHVKTLCFWQNKTSLLQN